MQKLFLIIFNFSCLLFFLIFNTFAYDNQVIHPRITEAAIDLYNSEYNNQISSEQKRQIIYGSISEDSDPRYLNHFYNPITNQGLKDSIFSGKSAKLWAQEQFSFVAYGGDYSESAILNNYRAGNFDRAYQGIGHILHLIEDMTVPAHVRNDAHPEKDPYEEFVQIFGYIKQDKLIIKNIDSLNQAFDELASFTYHNFLSKDTVDDKNILDKITEIKEEKDFEGKNVKYGYINQNKIIRIILRSNKIEYSFDPKVHASYWSLLHPQAISYSAGVIRYFFIKFAEIDSQREIKELNLWEKTKNNSSFLFNNFKYIIGDQASTLDIAKQNIIAIYLNSKQFLGFVQEAVKDTTISSTTQTITKTTVSTAIKTFNYMDETDIKTKNQTQKILKQPILSNIKLFNQNLSQLNNIKTTPAFQSAKPFENKVLGIKIKSPDNFKNQEDQINVPLTGIIPRQDFIFSSKGFQLDNEKNNEKILENNLEEKLLEQQEQEDSKKQQTEEGQSKEIEKNEEEFKNIENIFPDTKIILAPSQLSSSTQAFFVVSATPTESFVEFNLDDSGWILATTSTFIFSDLSESTHKIKFRSIYFNVTDSEPEEYEWLVDYTPPLVAINSLEEYYDNYNFIVSWQEIDQDFDLSSNIYYEGEYQISSSSNYKEDEWIKWFDFSPITEKLFEIPTATGTFVFFRIRAIDDIGNIGIWSEIQKTMIGKPSNFTRGTLVYSEDFEDDIADNWIITFANPAASLKVVNGKYHLKITSMLNGIRAVYQNGYNWSDYIFSFDVKFNDGVDREIYFRMKDSKNYYFLGLRGFWKFSPNETPVIFLAKCLAGVCTGHKYGRSDDLAIYDFTGNPNALNKGELSHFDIEVVGNHIKVFRNLELIIDWTDPQIDYPVFGTIGFYSWSGDYGKCDVEFDNFQIVNLAE